MFLIRLLFAFCLLCFTAKQSGYAVVKVQEKAKITCKVPDNDCEEKEEESVDKNELVNFYKIDRNSAIYSHYLVGNNVTIPLVVNFYQEFLLATVSPPPDRS